MPRETNDEPDVADLAFKTVLSAEADPIRLQIITQLAAADHDLSCGAIELPIKTSTATHHFTALRRAGVLHQYYAGASRMNVLREQDVEATSPGFLTSVIAATTSSPAH